MSQQNRTSQAVEELAQAARAAGENAFVSVDSISVPPGYAAAIAAKFKRMEDVLREAKTKLASGSWVATRTGYRDAAAAIDETYQAVEAALSYDPLSE